MEMSFFAWNMEMSFFAWNMEMSFFVVCPLCNCECKAPKIGMNCNKSLTILFAFDSSRFSGQISRIYTGIPKKDISILFSIFSFSGDFSALLKFDGFRIALSRAYLPYPELDAPDTYGLRQMADLLMMRGSEMLPSPPALLRFSRACYTYISSQSG
jgi:hypothetical protein